VGVGLRAVSWTVCLLRMLRPCSGTLPNGTQAAYVGLLQKIWHNRLVNDYWLWMSIRTYWLSTAPAEYATSVVQGSWSAVCTLCGLVFNPAANSTRRVVLNSAPCCGCSRCRML
jgi:hypothetical protein